MSLPWLGVAARLLTLLGLVAAIGALMAQGWLSAARPLGARLRWAGAAGCLLVALGAGLELGRAVLALSGGDPAMARAVLPALLQGATGRIVLQRLGLAGLIALRQAWRRPISAPEASLLALWLAATVAWDGHAADFAGLRRDLALGADTGHVFLAATWLGGLLAVAWLNRRALDASGLLRQFSRLASVAMPLVVLTGLLNAWLHLPPGGLAALWGFGWGRLLLLKSGLVLGILGLAWGLRRRVGGLEGGCLPLPAAIRRRLVLEAVVGLVVLGVTGLLSQTSPKPADKAAAVPGRVEWRMPDWRVG